MQKSRNYKLDHFIKLIIFALLAILSQTTYASERVRIVGSTAMYPIMTAIAERFAYENNEPAPIVEATGTGGGIKIFCSGVGKRFPDIVAASRPMSAAEKAFCRKNGVQDMHEILFAFDGIVLAHSIKRKFFSIHFSDLRKALGKSDPLPQKWSEVSSGLPAHFIRVFGPPSTSGTREALEMLLAQGDKNFMIRDDGRYINASDQENVIAQKLLIEPEAIGVFSYGFYEKNHDRLRAIRINGIRPHYEAIVTGQYPLARPLYIYVKARRNQAVGNLNLFIKAMVDPMTSGPEGYLREYGFIALPFEKHREVRQNVLQFLRESDNSE